MRLKIETVTDVLGHFVDYPSVIKYKEDNDSSAFNTVRIYEHKTLRGRDTVVERLDRYFKFCDEFADRKIVDFEFSIEEDTIYFWLWPND